MSKTRLEAFSDGVIAILITIMVLELKVPHGTSWEALYPTIFTLLLYLMSFVFLGIYWSNHHHLLHATDRVNGAILWANLHLLFWLSLVPFVTTWMGENGFAALPTSIYGLVLLLSAIAYTILQTKIIKHQGPDSKLKSAVGSDFKGKISMLMYLAGIFLAFVDPLIADVLYATVATMWLVPDKRIEARLAHE